MALKQKPRQPSRIGELAPGVRHGVAGAAEPVSKSTEGVHDRSVESVGIWHDTSPDPLEHEPARSWAPLVWPLLLSGAAVLLSLAVWAMVAGDPGGYRLFSSPLMPTMTASLLWSMCMAGGVLTSMGNLRMARWDQAHGDEDVSDKTFTLALRAASWSGLLLAATSVAFLVFSFF